MLTGDQNIIDIAYSVRWNIRDPELYLFQLAQPDETIREVAESAMRAVVATVSLDQAIGEGRGEIERRVTVAMQGILDAYRAGVTVQGVAIRQADPPQAVNEAFKEVTAAQQQAQSWHQPGQCLCDPAHRGGRRRGARRSTRSTNNTACRPTSPAGGCITRRWSRSCRTSTRRSSRLPA